MVWPSISHVLLLNSRPMVHISYYSVSSQWNDILSRLYSTNRSWIPFSHQWLCDLFSHILTTSIHSHVATLLPKKYLPKNSGFLHLFTPSAFKQVRIYNSVISPYLWLWASTCLEALWWPRKTNYKAIPHRKLIHESFSFCAIFKSSASLYRSCSSSSSLIAHNFL